MAVQYRLQRLGHHLLFRPPFTLSLRQCPRTDHLASIETVLCYTAAMRVTEMSAMPMNDDPLDALAVLYVL